VTLGRALTSLGLLCFWPEVVLLVPSPEGIWEKPKDGEWSLPFSPAGAKLFPGDRKNEGLAPLLGGWGLFGQETLH
jgi:hypothetical protein